MNEFYNKISILLLPFHPPDSHKAGHTQPMFKARIELGFQ